MIAPGQLAFGKYRVDDLLGEGGMGTVYGATEELGGRRVALKVVRLEHATDPTQLARFKREARAAAGIETQHIARVFDAGVDAESGTPYIAMERLDGEDVRALVARLGAVRPDLALRICAQACVGLAKAHEADVIHRDIKGANVFVASVDDGFLVKLLDFGVAKMQRDPSDLDASKSLTQTGGLVGSPLYMSPEQAIGSKTVDARADVFSLGTVLYFMLTGRLPHEAHGTLGRLIIAICQEPAAHVQDLAPWVPASVAAIVHKAVEIDPGDRYPTALAMLDALGDELPDGWEIAPGALAPMTADEKSVVEERLALPRGRGRVPVSPFEDTQREGPAPDPPATTQDGRQSTTVGTRGPRRRTISLVAAGIVVAAGTAVFATSRVSPRVEAHPIAATPAPDSPRVTAALPLPPGSLAPEPAVPAPPSTAAPSPVLAAPSKTGHATSARRPEPSPAANASAPAPPTSAPPPARKLGTSDSFE